MNTGDIFSLAYRTVRSNKLRTGLTVAIIAFGIMALVGIITAIKAMNQKFSESFSTMAPTDLRSATRKDKFISVEAPIRSEDCQEGKKKGKDLKPWKSDHR
jgi:putative ABC transport system permease protein